MKWMVVLILLSWMCPLRGQELYRRELLNLLEIENLPVYREGTMRQFSSYDRTGGNDDGFSGRFSYLRKEGKELVIADLKGAGVINRIWTPTPALDTIRFYFDGEKIPRIAIPFIDLFSGKCFPFVSPLCDSELGGYFCYLPISYSKSLKITYQGDDLKFHQTQFRALPKHTGIESFSTELFRKNQDVLEQITQLWKGGKRIFDSAIVKSRQVDISIRPGEVKNCFRDSLGGRIVGIEWQTGEHFLNKNKDLIFTACWDGEEQNAFELPLADFLGYAFGQPAMRGLLCGTTQGLGYCYLPMPYDGSADLRLKYLRRKGMQQKEVHTRVKVYYTDKKRNSREEGKLYAQWRHEKPVKGQPYVIADIRGKGHYVGTTLIAQGLEGGMTFFWEGDDCSVVDGDTTFQGTGSEDYFNGGWYAVTDRWDRGMSCPLHGALDYDIMNCRTGGYRFFLSDKINFEKSYHFTIEHGPENNLSEVDYTSVAFFYAEKPQFQNTPVDLETTKIGRLSKHIVLAQDFTIRPYWFSTYTLNDGYAEIRSENQKSWMTNIDFEAVPMVQFELKGLAEGKYHLTMVYYKQEAGKDFSVWQRTKALSDWVTTTGKEGELVSKEVGEIEINEQLTTITLRRKKSDSTYLKIHSFVLVPID